MTVDRRLALPLDAIVAGFQSMMFCLCQDLRRAGTDRAAGPVVSLADVGRHPGSRARRRARRCCRAGLAFGSTRSAPGVQNGLPCCRTRKRCGRHRAEHPHPARLSAHPQRLPCQHFGKPGFPPDRGNGGGSFGRSSLALLVRCLTPRNWRELAGIRCSC